VARARATYLSEREKEFLHEKTLEVLEKVGVAYNTPQAIDLLASAAGAEVDRDALTAKHNLQAGSEGMLTGLACALAGADSMLAFGLMAAPRR
jgi:trimethylamine:corrinoid methyltransferase-like protein